LTNYYYLSFATLSFGFAVIRLSLIAVQLNDY